MTGKTLPRIIEEIGGFRFFHDFSKDNVVANDSHIQASDIKFTLSTTENDIKQLP